MDWKWDNCSSNVPVYLPGLQGVRNGIFDPNTYLKEDLKVEEEKNEDKNILPNLLFFGDIFLFTGFSQRSSSTRPQK